MARELRITDLTLTATDEKWIPKLTFREKIEVAKLLDRLGVSVIEIGSPAGGIADALLLKSIASAVNDAVVAVCPGFDPAVIESMWNALKTAKKPRLQVCAAVSTSRMEYVYRKKADQMLQTAVDTVRLCRTYCGDVEFIAEDATRADEGYLARVTEAVVEAGATTVTLCDTAGVMLPHEFGAFLASLKARVPVLGTVTVGARSADMLSVACASSVEAIRAGAGQISVSARGNSGASLFGMAELLFAKAESLGVTHPLRSTEIHRIQDAIDRLCTKAETPSSPFEDGVRQQPEGLAFTAKDGIEAVNRGAEKLGYDLTAEDRERVYRAFCKVASRKECVSLGELDAIIAAEALQVPATYTLENYVVTTGNAIGILAHVKLKKQNESFDGLSLGDGPIDAAFLAIEKITGHHYELDDFQIRAVTEGREAMGETVVKLRAGGKVYSGRGLSTDIVGSGVAAYVNALNKIIYEEENA